MGSFRVAFVALGLLAITTAASAQVTNGGFETGSTEFGVPLGWTTDAPPLIDLFLDNGSFATNFGVPGPHTGAWDVLVGPNTDLWLTQNLSTQSGQQYDVTFWLYNKTGNSIDDFSAYWGGTAPIVGELGSQDNGTQLLSISNAGNFGWTEYSATVTAPTTSTALTFFGANRTDFFGLDDVSVTASNQNPNGTPEPGTLALLISGGIAAAGFLKRRRE